MSNPEEPQQPYKKPDDLRPLLGRIREQRKEFQNTVDRLGDLASMIAAYQVSLRLLGRISRFLEETVATLESLPLADKQHQTSQDYQSPTLPFETSESSSLSAPATPDTPDDPHSWYYLGEHTPLHYERGASEEPSPDPESEGPQDYPQSS